MPSCFHGILLQPGVSPPSPVTAFFSSCLERWFFTLHVRHRILWSACNKSYIKTYFKQENNLMQLQKESSRYPVWIIFYWTLPVFAAGEASVTPSPPGVAYGTGLLLTVGSYSDNICNCKWLLQENTRYWHNMAAAAVLQLQSAWAALQSRPRGRTACVVIITWTLLHI